MGAMSKRMKFSKRIGASNPVGMVGQARDSERLQTAFALVSVLPQAKSGGCPYWQCDKAVEKNTDGSSDYICLTSSNLLKFQLKQLYSNLKNKPVISKLLLQRTGF